MNTGRADDHASANYPFTDPRLCAAIVDRVTFGGNIIETGTVSYQLGHTRSADGERGRPILDACLPTTEPR